MTDQLIHLLRIAEQTAMKAHAEARRLDPIEHGAVIMATAQAEDAARTALRQAQSML